VLSGACETLQLAGICIFERVGIPFMSSGTKETPNWRSWKLHLRMGFNPVRVKWGATNSPFSCQIHFPMGLNPLHAKWSVWNSPLTQRIKLLHLWMGLNPVQFKRSVWNASISWQMHCRKGLNPVHVKWNEGNSQLTQLKITSSNGFESRSC